MEIKQTAEYRKWFKKLRNREAKAAIQARLDACKLAGRPFGDIKPVGGPVSEMRFHIGAGYRVYFTTRGNVLMLLLAGGDKSTQQTDIKQAHAILDDYKEQQLAPKSPTTTPANTSKTNRTSSPTSTP